MQNIYLVGFMGTGKTATAKLVAKSLNRSFVDMDAIIEEREKMPISEIFKTKGEPYFRHLERGLVLELAAQERLVVACGGGAFANDENIAAMKKSGSVVCLTSSPRTILRRTQGNTARPLLNVENPESRIAELLKKRAPYYGQAHHTVDADNLTVEETAQEALRCLAEK